MAPATGYFRRLTRRLTEDIEDIDAEEIAESSQATGARKAADCLRGEEVTMCGRLRSVETCSKAASATVEHRQSRHRTTARFFGIREPPRREAARQ